MNVKIFHRLLSIFVLIILAQISNCIPPDDEFGRPDAPQTDAQMYYDTIPVEKREIFIRYYLGEALKEQGNLLERTGRMVGIIAEQEFGAPPPEGFISGLLDWTKDNFELEDHHVQQIVEHGYVCVAAKGCYYSDNIGGHCCPY
ncbi:CLUMA_CG019452, isoform A [Clunio marinus]|uniref:CLUMA_CG019452, isoform A n=1 Tax=Clunio marinus TaxID=568069 RepID=A0A1J1J2S1_9DIPT|nr:CLUMA_CG019452, isoform A [Clunio marinus]